MNPIDTLPPGWEKVLGMFAVDLADFRSAFVAAAGRFKDYVPADWVAAVASALDALDLSPAAILAALIAASKSGYWKSHGGVA